MGKFREDRGITVKTRASWMCEGVSLGSPVEAHDGQMPPSLVEPDPQNSWPLQNSLSPFLSAVDLVGCATTETGVRAMQRIPFEED